MCAWSVCACNLEAGFEAYHLGPFSLRSRLMPACIATVCLCLTMYSSVQYHEGGRLAGCQGRRNQGFPGLCSCQSFGNCQSASGQPPTSDTFLGPQALFLSKPSLPSPFVVDVGCPWRWRGHVKSQQRAARLLRLCCKSTLSIWDAENIQSTCSKNVHCITTISGIRLPNVCE